MGLYCRAALIRPVSYTHLDVYKRQVMHQGTITGTFANDGTLTQEKILYYATGGDLHTA